VSEVLCTHCGRSGEVTILRIKGKSAQVDDQIDHEDDCVVVLKYRKRVQPKHLKKKNWRGQEKRAAKLLNTHATPASGALGEDGDARRFHGMRVECKQSSSGQFSLSQDVWSKLCKGAIQAGETPVLQVELTDEATPWRCYVVPQNYLPYEVEEISQRYARARLHLYRGLESQTPFSVSVLDPPPAVLTEFQMLKAFNDAE
jgi:hypothetical protein